MIESNVTNNNKSPISWGAIFAGTFVALGVELLLALLGLAIGLWNVSPTTGTGQLAGVGIGEGIWWVITSIISLFLGGWVAGRLCGFLQFSTMLHGLTVWALVSVFTIYLITVGVGSIIGGAFGILQQGLGAAGSAAQSSGLVQQLSQQIQQQIQSITRPNGQQLTPQERDQIVAAAQKIMSPGGDTPDNRQNLANALAQAGGMSPQDARNTVDQWVTAYQNTMKSIAQGAAATAQALGTAAFWAFIMLLLTGAAAIFGAAVGTNWRRT